MLSHVLLSVIAFCTVWLIDFNGVHTGWWSFLDHINFLLDSTNKLYILSTEHPETSWNHPNWTKTTKRHSYLLWNTWNHPLFFKFQLKSTKHYIPKNTLSPMPPVMRNLKMLQFQRKLTQWGIKRCQFPGYY